LPYAGNLYKSEEMPRNTKRLKPSDERREDLSVRDSEKSKSTLEILKELERQKIEDGTLVRVQINNTIIYTTQPDKVEQRYIGTMV